MKLTIKQLKHMIKESIIEASDPDSSKNKFYKDAFQDIIKVLKREVANIKIPPDAEEVLQNIKSDDDYIVDPELMQKVLEIDLPNYIRATEAISDRAPLRTRYQKPNQELLKALNKAVRKA